MAEQAGEPGCGLEESAFSLVHVRVLSRAHFRFLARTMESTNFYIEFVLCELNLMRKQRSLKIVR